MPAPKSMRIVSLSAENFKRLKAVAIRPNGNVVEITGRNGAGKSSVLDAIWAALAGKKAIQKQPVRKGQERAEIVLDLGHLKVRRTFSDKGDEGFGTALTVTSEDGGKFNSPQDVLDTLCGEFSFEPLAFTRLKPEEQFNSLRKLVPGVDFDALDRLDAADYDKRTEKNRAAKHLRVQAEAIKLPEKIPARVDEAALVQKLETAAQENSGIENERRRRAFRSTDLANEEDDAAEKRRRVAALRAEIEKLEKEANEIDARVKAGREELAALPELPPLIDVSQVSAELKAAKEANAVVDAFDRKADLIADAEIAEAASADFTAAIEGRMKQRLEAIAAANIPVDGLGFGDKVVLLNGVPFNQASDAEQLRAAIGIAAALNPTLRVIRVRDGSLLDEDSLKLLEQFAEANDLQVWIERVDSSGKVGIVIEDGLVAQPVKEAAQ